MKETGKILHIDLFAGIGGFSYAVDCVFGKENVKHTFVEINDFCQAVLKKHWEDGVFYGDIKEFITESKINKEQSSGERFTILTGGFPCQPFSLAGQRQGKQDNRYLWPEMFRTIQLTKPQWVIAENVYGLLTIEGGLVFEQVCSDLEAEGYEVQPLIIPAVSVNAPHRRDRVWIVANKPSKRLEGRNIQQTARTRGNECGSENLNASNPRCKRQAEQQKQTKRSEQCDFNASNSTSWQPRKQTEQEGRESFSRRDWEREWKEVALERCVCELDDGLSRRMVRLPSGRKISYARWRQEGIKAFGNAIVPQVAMKLFEAVKYTGVEHYERKTY